ncbi:unnamed protein product [Calypogeia fissa]
MEQEDHAHGQITGTSEQISEVPPQAEMEQEERDIVAELGDMEQQGKVFDTQQADLNEQIMEMSLNMRAAEGTSESVMMKYIALLKRHRQISEDQIALLKRIYQARIALREGITISSWLKQALIHLFVAHLLLAMAGVRGDYKISPSDGFGEIAVVTPGGEEPSLSVDVKKLNSFRNSEAEPLRDLVEAYEGFRLQGSDAILANSIRQCISYMAKFRVRYSVLTSVDASYFLRWETNGAKESLPHLEISEGIALEAKEPTLVQCLYCIIGMAIREMDSFKEFEPDLIDESSNQQQVESAGSPRSPDDDGDWSSPDESGADDDAVSRPQTRSDTRKRCKINEETQLQLHETRASDLHLDRFPLASGVVLGRVKGCRAVVKLAMKYSDRGKALLKEVRAYTKLMDYWGKCVPKLVDYGTTAQGQLIFIATEFVKHNPRELLDEAIANAARKALRSVHVSGMLHGDVHEDNILVTKGGVQFIDFGFAKFNPNKAECEEELELLEKFILKKKRT